MYSNGVSSNFWPAPIVKVTLGREDTLEQSKTLYTERETNIIYLETIIIYTRN